MREGLPGVPGSAAAASRPWSADVEQRWTLIQHARGQARQEGVEGYGCAMSAMDPPRPISNRAVKRSSAAGTGAAALGDKVRASIPHAYLSRRGAVAARRAHNPKVDGSNPSAATIA